MFVFWLPSHRLCQLHLHCLHFPVIYREIPKLPDPCSGQPIKVDTVADYLARMFGPHLDLVRDSMHEVDIMGWMLLLLLYFASRIASRIARRIASCIASCIASRIDSHITSRIASRIVSHLPAICIVVVTCWLMILTNRTVWCYDEID